MKATLTEVFEDIKFIREDNDKPRCSARIWIGRSQKPTYNYSFKSVERREEFIAEQKLAASRRVVCKAERAAERKAACARRADPETMIREAKPGQYFSPAETASLARYRLGKVFPGVKFSVTSDGSLNVRWTLGPTADEVKRVVSCFGGQGFDGMIDMRFHYDAWLLPDGSVSIAHSPGTTDSAGTVSPIDTDAPHPKAVIVHFGADFVFCNRNVPDELSERVGRDLCALQRVEYREPRQRGLCGQNDPRCLDEHVSALLSHTSFPVDGEYAGVEYDDGRHWVKAVVKSASEAVTT